MRRFWRGLVIFLFGGVLGTAFGVALGFFVYPFVFPPPAAMDQLSEADKAKLIATGTFIHANPSDPIHWGKGKVSGRTSAPCSSSPTSRSAPGRRFTSTSCPRPASGRTPTSATRCSSISAACAPSRAASATRFPAGVDLKNYQSVIIWCRQFSVLISPADLMLAAK